MADFQDQPAMIRVGEELDRAKLQAFLSKYFEHADSLAVAQYPSGHSNLTYFIRLGNQEFVLRRPPFGNKVKTAHDMGREYRVLSKLDSAYPAAPKVVLYCDDESVLGAPFYLMKPIHGMIIRKDPPVGLPFPADVARQLSERFVEALAALHRLDYQAIGLGDLGRPQGYLDRQIRGWVERYYGSQTHDLPEVPRIAAWLEAHTPEAMQAALIHNDYKYDNVVLASEDITRIVGVLDWEMATIGDPLADLGTTLAYWVDKNDAEDLQEIRWCPSTYPGSMTRRELVEHYARLTGHDVSRMVFYLALARFKIAVTVQQIYFRYHSGLTQDPRFAHMPDKVRALLRHSLLASETSAI
jgi:aminoglycoside phosphotransferase (APT) family kinase protein